MRSNAAEAGPIDHDTEAPTVMLSPLKIVSIMVCVMLVAGYLNRRRPRVHVPLMLGAFLIDLGIVVCIEVARDVIASARAKMGPLMIVHITLSSAVVILYVTMVVTGIKNARRKTSSTGERSAWHRNAGPWLLLARFGNLLTSFLVS